jgi:hypothetical protein
LRRCSKCGVEKDDSAFGARSRGGLRGYCKPCDSAWVSRWAVSHPERARAISHKTRIGNGRRRAALYGIGPRDFWDLLEYQEGICPYCLKALDPNALLNLDHAGGKKTRGDWTKVRGILHWRCNRQLSDHTIASLHRALTYLESPPAWELWGSNHIQTNIDTHSNPIQTAV